VQNTDWNVTRQMYMANMHSTNLERRDAGLEEPGVYILYRDSSRAKERARDSSLSSMCHSNSNAFYTKFVSPLPSGSSRCYNLLEPRPVRQVLVQTAFVARSAAERNPA